VRVIGVVKVLRGLGVTAQDVKLDKYPPRAGSNRFLGLTLLFPFFHGLALRLGTAYPRWDGDLILATSQTLLYLICYCFNYLRAGFSRIFRSSNAQDSSLRLK
jgi:hypothetical protein